MKPRTVLAFAAGPIMTAALSALTIPAIAWAFSPADVGRLNLLQVVVSFTVLAFGLGLDQAYVREFHGAPDRPALLRTTAAPGLAILGVAAVLLGTQAERLSRWLYASTDPVYFWLTLLCVVAAYAARFVSLVLRMQERAIAFSASQVVPKLALIAAVGSLILLDMSHNFLTLALAFTASTVVGLLGLAWWARADIQAGLTSRFDRRHSRELLRYSIPLMLAALAYSGFNATSSFVLRTRSSFDQLGIYSITTSVAGVAAIAQAIFSMIWAPIVYKWVANNVDMARIETVTRQALAIVAAIFALCGSFSWLADFVLPHQYSVVKSLITAAVAQPLLYTLSEVTGIGVGITRRTTLSLWSTLLALTVNFVLSLMLVPHSGATGAIVANAAGYLAFFAARTEASAIVWRSFARTRTYAFVLATVALSIANAAAGPTLGRGFSLVWLATTPVIGCIFRSEWRDLWRSVRTNRSR